jgi:hypothetical protein
MVPNFVGPFRTAAIGNESQRTRTTREPAKAAKSTIPVFFSDELNTIAETHINRVVVYYDRFNDK